MQIRVRLVDQASVRALDLPHVCAGADAQHMPSVASWCRARGSRRVGATIARAPSPAEKFLGAKRHVGERAARGSNGNAETDLRVAKPLEDLEALAELAAECIIDDGGGQPKVADQHLAVKAARGHCPQERAAQRVLVDRLGATQHFRQRRRSAIELYGSDVAAKHVNAMRASAHFGELERSRCTGAVERAEEIAERCRAKAAR